MEYEYFTDKDFKKCNPSCSIDDMDEELLILLDKMRKIIDKPIILNSAYRTVKYEKSKKRTGNSSHTKGCAVDIRCATDSYKFLIVQTALALGIKRIGVGDVYVHIDIDKDKAQNVIWTY